MEELERLKRRRASWAKVTAPSWMVRLKPKTLSELDAQIARLEAEQSERKKRWPTYSSTRR